MRMWNVNPKLMCRQHLLGEHLEMHMFTGCLRNRVNLFGYIRAGLVEIKNIKKRHDKLVIEMKRRGYNHKTPIKYFPYKTEKTKKIDVKFNIKELKRRCKECRKRMKECKNGI